MDLKQFIQTHKNNGTLDSIIDGFEKSSFVEPNSDTSVLIKSILSVLISDEDGDKQKIYNQLQSGGLANAKSGKTEISKKQSFCTEFNQMVINILGLLGSEFSKYLFVLMGAKHMIAQEINAIAESQDYNSILKHIINIKNFMSLGDVDDYSNTEELNYRCEASSNFETPIDIDDEFFEEFYLEQETSENQNYLEIEVKSNKKNNMFNQLISEIKQLIKSENILSFEDDRQEWCQMLEEMLSHIILKTYHINSIDDLCLNLTGINVCYDKSFIKMFEILYKESFADIPYDLWSTYKPHISYIEKELKLDIKCSKYLTNFNKYFHKVYDETLKSVVEKIPQEDVLKINVTDKMYELLSDITFNLYVNISKKISCNQLTYAYFGKSTRIQFIQMFQALMDCSPRLYVFTKSQRMTLHYILLSKKVINESIKIVNGMNETE